MWSWFKHVRERPARSPFRLFPRAPRAREIRFGYEKADVTVQGESLPWNADAAFVEARVEFSPRATISRNDFDLDVPGEVPCTAVTLRPEPGGGAARVLFRFAPPQRARLANVLWRSRVLGQVLLPHVGPDDFLRNLRLEVPALFVHLGGRNIAFRALVEGQSGALTAVGLLKSVTSLLPAMDWPLRVEIVDQTTGQSDSVLLPLTGAELTGRQTLLSVPLPPRPRPAGAWCVRWSLGGRVLGRSDFRVLPRQAFRESLYVPGGSRPGRARGTVASLGACLQVASREPGMAALCPVEVLLRGRDQTCLMQCVLGDVLVTEAPSPWVPAPGAVNRLPRVEALELFSEGRFLGRVAWEPAPAATFTSEGGFVHPETIPWTVSCEAELEERLSRLMVLPPA